MTNEEVIFFEEEEDEEIESEPLSGLIPELKGSIFGKLSKDFSRNDF